MLAGLLHDLKTPMTIISGYAQLMAASDDADAARQVRRADPAPVRPDGRHDARGARVRARRHRPRRPQGLRQPVRRGADDAARRGGRRAAASTSRSRRSYDGVAYFDEQKLMRVFHNLASNAIEAMPEGGHLRVSDRRATATTWCGRVARHRARASRPRCTAGCSSCSRPAARAAPASASRSSRRSSTTTTARSAATPARPGTTFVIRMPLDASATDATGAIGLECVLALRGIDRAFGAGARVAGVSLEVAARRGGAARRPQRRGQDDAAADRDRLPRSRRRRGHVDGIAMARERARAQARLGYLPEHAPAPAELTRARAPARCARG